MGETRRYDLGAQLDIPQILAEAQHRWLRPAEICEILQNHKKFVITPEPANRPPNGSLFLFDRKVLRYFRKDGHDWRKKKDGKTVKEAHERLKAGSIDVLHCYYAHGEENESFQRRSYWLLEEERSNIVLVHYREVKGNRTNFNRIKEVGETIPNSLETEESTPISEVDTSVSSKFHPYNYQVTSQSTDTTSLNSTQASEYEDAESAYNQPSSSFHSFLGLQTPGMARMDDAFAVPYHPAPFSNDYQGNFPAISEMDFVSLPQGDNGRNSFDSSLTYEPQGHLDFPSWENILEIQSASFQPSHSSTQPDTVTNISRQRNEIAATIDAFGRKQEFGNHPHVQEEWKTSEGSVSHTSNWSMNQKLYMDSAYKLTSRFHEGDISSVDLYSSLKPTHPSEKNKHTTLDNPQLHGSSLKQELESNLLVEGKANLMVEGKANHSSLKQPLLGNFIKEGLKKLDSFDRWMSKELGDVNDLQMQSSSGVCWDVIRSEDGVDDSSITPQAHLDNYILSPSLSQDQLFSIIDFSPNWAYTGSEMKVLITGRFLKSEQDVEKCKWACMFGELEVPAEVIADDVLCCCTPKHEGGRVPFYVTCSNRLSCSEVREFEFRINDVRDMDFTDISRSEILLHTRFQNFLSLGPVSDNVSHDPILSSELSSLLKEDENVWDQMMMSTSEDDFTVEKVRDQLLQKLLKENLYAWLLQKTGEGGKGPNVLDDGGQGVLHFAAALGYDWAIAPTIAAGVSINFRDVNGWTALHWAASCGRERTVGLLISLEASPGALTDPTPIYPSGRMPADLASSNGHKGIAGYLAESALSSHLLSLKLKDTKDDNTGDFSRVTAVRAISDRTPTPISDGDLPHGLSLKDSLAAVCHATQAAAQIHQVFRVQSFQKKQQLEYGDGEFGLSDERALSLLAVKSNRAGQQDEPVHSAAIHIQNKFRSWKGRKEYLIIRQRIVKIQAHVRGHQVRKNYRKIIWSVGILDKVILRWRRKGSGLRGFKPEALAVGPAMKETPSKDDDYDFLKEGRKQSEERMQKALSRVKSMVQYPEARDQYRRLLNVVTEIQGAKAANDRALNSSAEVADFDDLIDIQSFLDDDTMMSTEY